jgi:hypothetical protein
MEMLHTHCLINISSILLKLKAQIELNSISMSKNDPKLTKFVKYDVDASIDEVENNDEQSIFTYSFTALSNPKNVRLSIEGTAHILGDSIERDEILNKDEEGIPKILTMIYQELFPTFFLLSKTMNVSCPPHTIGTINNGLVDEVDSVSEISEMTEGGSDELPEPQPEQSSDQIENPDITQPTS